MLRPQVFSDKTMKEEVLKLDKKLHDAVIVKEDGYEVKADQKDVKLSRNKFPYITGNIKSEKGFIYMVNLTMGGKSNPHISLGKLSSLRNGRLVALSKEILVSTNKNNERDAWFRLPMKKK